MLNVFARAKLRTEAAWLKGTLHELEKGVHELKSVFHGVRSRAGDELRYP